jgi:hypothetical protein
MVCVENLPVFPSSRRNVATDRDFQLQPGGRRCVHLGAIVKVQSAAAAKNKSADNPSILFFMICFFSLETIC